MQNKPSFWAQVAKGEASAFPATPGSSEIFLTTYANTKNKSNISTSIMDRASQEAFIEKVLLGDRLPRTLADIRSGEATDRETPPTPIEHTNLSGITSQMKLLSDRFESTGESQDMGISQIIIGCEPKFSSSPLSQLRRVCFKEMSVYKRHEGCFLLCRIVTPPLRGACVELGVEDPDGWTQRLSLYNFPGTYFIKGQELNTIFPLNTIIAIREPTVKWDLARNGSVIRVDSPSDAIFIDPDNPMLTKIAWANGTQPPTTTTLSLAEWKSIGNDHFKEKQFFAAAVAYTYALRQDPSSVAVRLNRCLAHNRLSNFTASLYDAKIVVETEDVSKTDRTKALYRAAQAQYGNAKYEEAKKYYTDCLSVDPDTEDAKIGIKRCRARIQERDHAKYNWKQLFLQSEPSCARPDVADYTGHVKVASIQTGEGGQGVVATRDIKAGELLVISKALAMGFPGEVRPVITLNLLTESSSKRNQYSILHQAVTKVAGNYHQAGRIFDLPAGPNFTKRLSMPTPGTSGDTSDIGDPIKFTEDIDTAYIEAVVSFNSFEFPHSSKIVGFTSPSAMQQVDNSIALHIFPSFINHACLANARWETFGHIMVIRSVHDIAAGEEVTISYCGSRIPFGDRKKPVLRYFDKCNCALCSSDRAAGKRFQKAHKRIYDQLDEMHNPTINSTKELVSEVDPIFPDSYPGFRPLSFHAHRTLADQVEKAAMLADNVISRKRLSREAIKHEIISLESLGAQVIDKAIVEPPVSERETRLPVSLDRIPYDTRAGSMSCFMISGSLIKLNARWRAEMWLRTAVWFENNTFGGGIPLFRVRYARIMNVLGPDCTALLDRIEGSP